MTKPKKPRPLFDPPIVKQALKDCLLKLTPARQARNPVMFTVYAGSILTTLLAGQALWARGEASFGFTAGVAAWLWATVIFASFAESLAEGRGKAQAAALRGLRRDVSAKRLPSPDRNAAYETVTSRDLHRGDLVLVEAGDTVPSDGDIVEGVASVDESAITGESAPVIREAGGDRSAVTGGTRLLSDWLVVRVAAEAGETFLDRMISLVEGARRRKTPNEIALNILLASLTLVFLVVCATLRPLSAFSMALSGQGEAVSLTALTALFVCLAPTTIGGLLSAIGIAGMDRLIQAGVLAASGRAVEAAGDVDILLLDKTGTITLGNRQATVFLPVTGVSERELAEVAQLASLADETPEGRSIVVLAKERFGIRAHHLEELGASFVPFTAQTRLSGVNLPGRLIRKGAPDAIKALAGQSGELVPEEIERAIHEVARSGGTPLLVAENGRPLGTVWLKDIVKGGIRERFAQLRAMGIKTIMVTGDNSLTAAAIAAEAGVDDFLAEATPEAKLARIRQYQAEGKMVAMTGDGTNDAPALAQADVGVAMNSGTQAAKEAGNMVDLDSNPTKLLEIVAIGKQLLMTRGSLTTFSISNDLAKYFAIIPAVFAGIYPQLGLLDVMGLATPKSAILSAVVFNALVIVFLIPLALKGVRYLPAPAATALRHNLLVYGLGGLAVPFAGIKLIDMIIQALGLA